jgi:predicted metal-dependent hydrolase
MNNTVRFGEREITYQLERKRVKNINLRIRHDCSVYVSANKKVPFDIIKCFLIKKSAYILTAIDKYSDRIKFACVAPSYITGESFRYLGKELRLKVTEEDNKVYSDGIYLHLGAANANDIEKKSKLINQWYWRQCQEIFNTIIEELHLVFHKYSVHKPTLIIKEMTTRWGSCQTKRNTITLNKRLIEAPHDCIEYVIMHEFIHFLHPNHSKKFYELLSTLMPDWKERKKVLESKCYFQIEKTPQPDDIKNI